jgi:maleate cis-trans isomerase
MRKNITKEELQKIYYENNNFDAAFLLGVSKVTLIKMVTDAGIELKGKGYAQKYFVL